jgi:hypothetical protein
MALPIAGKGHEAPAGLDFTWFVYGSSLEREAFARLSSDARPAPAYLEVLVRGARASGLSEEWIHRLEALRAAGTGR